MDEYSRLPFSLFSPFYTWLSQPDAGVQELEIPRMILRGVRLRGVVRRSQAGGLAFSIVATFVLAFLRQTCLTYVCTQILLLPLTRLWSSTCIRALEAPGLYYDACMTYLCFRVVLWYLPVSPWSWSYTFACMISVRLNRGRHKLVSEPTACRNPPSTLLGRSRD